MSCKDLLKMQNIYILHIWHFKNLLVFSAVNGGNFVSLVLQGKHSYVEEIQKLYILSHFSIYKLNFSHFSFQIAGFPKIPGMRKHICWSAGC